MFMASSIICRILIRRLSALPSATSLRALSSSSFQSPASASSSWFHHFPSRDNGMRIPVSFSIRKALFASSISPPSEGFFPTADYRSLLQEDEFHKLADETINCLQERFEEYGDEIQIDGFDIDYGNQVLTLKLGDLGTYVVNKQTPNRQIWLSSPVSGPSRFDWDENSEAWIYRRTKANLLHLLEDEVTGLCGKPICLS